jgi:CRISPR system Cascade subunit CasA
VNKFNLTKEPWIPCLMLDGAIEELSLLDTLAKAHDIKEIADDSPLVVVSLHRLLLAILHRNFGPKNFEEWKNIWRKGFWDKETLESYFDEWGHRFNLFDDERPFYQYPQVLKSSGKEADVVPVEILMQEKSGGNNATLFDHSFEENPKTYAAGFATKYLIARQMFSIGFGKSYPFYFSDSTLIRGFTFLVYGKNLFETLALNLIVYNRKDKPIPSQDEDGVCLDEPFWERKQHLQASESDNTGTSLLGYLDYLTWQSRRIKLFPDKNYRTVTLCQIQQNFKLSAENIFDPFKTYKFKDKDGWTPKVLVPEKSLWRDSHTILRKDDNATHQAELFKHLAKVWKSVDDGEISGQKNYSLTVFGLATEIGKAANVLMWAQERLPLPLIYLDDNELVSLLETATNFAEEIGNDVLKRSVVELAKLLKTDAANFPAMSVYWASLELEFQDLLSGLPKDNDAAMKKWFGVVLSTANDTFRQTANSLSGAAKEQKAIVEAEGTFHRQKNILRSKHQSDYGIYWIETKAKGGNQ